MINHVDGCVAFAMSVERVYAERMRERWTDALAADGFRP